MTQLDRVVVLVGAPDTLIPMSSLGLVGFFVLSGIFDLELFDLELPPTALERKQSY